MTRNVIPMPRIAGATLFDEEDLAWGLGIQRHAIGLIFSRSIDKLVLEKKQATFLAKGLRWLAAGCTLYSGVDGTGTEQTGGNDPGLIELGCVVKRENGSVVIDFGRSIKRWVWSPAAADYAAGRISVEAKALL